MREYFLFTKKSKKPKSEWFFTESLETPREKALRHGTLSLMGSGYGFWLMIACLASVPQGALFVLLAVIGSMATVSLLGFSGWNFFKAVQNEPNSSELNQYFLAIN